MSAQANNDYDGFLSPKHAQDDLDLLWRSCLKSIKEKKDGFPPSSFIFEQQEVWRRLEIFRNTRHPEETPYVLDPDQMEGMTRAIKEMEDAVKLSDEFILYSSANTEIENIVY
jgi:hypothetical protein